MFINTTFTVLKGLLTLAVVLVLSRHFKSHLSLLHFMWPARQMFPVGPFPFRICVHRSVSSTKRSVCSLSSPFHVPKHLPQLPFSSKLPLSIDLYVSSRPFSALQAKDNLTIPNEKCKKEPTEQKSETEKKRNDWEPNEVDLLSNKELAAFRLTDTILGFVGGFLVYQVYQYLSEWPPGCQAIVSQASEHAFVKQ